MNGARILRLKAARLALCLSALAFAAAASWPAWREGGAPATREAVAPRPSPAETLTAFYTDRNALREEEIAQLTALAGQADTSDEIRAAAQRRIMALREWMEEEATVEAVLRARGYETALVTVHADSANILILADRVSREDAAVMLELTARETGITGGNIKIIPIN
ncbi:MAG: SpoIIIAH-like family protein [Clostridia bacterium]|nr:SpoIIIAH-like family protein [Clostridia bacterium]